MKEFDKLLNEYASLIVKFGINIKQGQPLVINAPTEGIEFVRLLAKHAYKLGASDVHVNWTDEILTKLKYKYAPIDVFENYPKWHSDNLEDYAKRGAGFISISALDPNLLKDADSKKVAANNKASSLALKKWRKYTMNDINPWCILSIPTKSWAKRIFKDVDGDQAVKLLWDSIFKSTRMYSDDPIKAWQDHMSNLKSKVDYLNKANFKSLHFTSSNGTDIHVELPKGHIWAGGGAISSKNVVFAPNIPTEEVFTMPKRTGVNGTVYSTKPLNYGGRLIDDFKLVFKDGKVTEYDAKIGKEVLEDLFDIDEGAMYLGEVALVPYDSPISNSKIVYINTLFDENASCHFAFGKAYPTNIKGGEKMSDKELEKSGANISLTHVDFMIGDKDTNIIAITKDNTEVEVFKSGNWAI